MSARKLQTLSVDLQLLSNNYDARIESHRAKTRAYATQAKAANDANIGLGKTFRGLANQAAVLDGPMGGLSGRLSAVASGVSAIGVGGFAAAAGLAVLTAGAYQGLNVFAQWEQQQFRTEALLRSTGNASGLTANQINRLSRSVALATLASVEGINDATSVLMTFKTVQEDVFVDAIGLAQDMAAVMGGDAKSAALQLGKALEDPTTGLNALKRSGVSFSQSEKDVIKSLQDTNQLADAQRLILQKLSDQVGGAGSAQAQGLSGSLDTLGQRYDEFLFDLTETSRLGTGAAGAVNGLAGAIAALNRDLFPDDDQRLGELVHEQQALLQEIQEMNAQGGKEALPLINPFGYSKNDWTNTQRRYSELTSEIAVLTRNFNRERESEEAAAAAAREAREAAMAEATAQRIKERQEAESRALAQRKAKDDALLDRQQQAGVSYLARLDVQFADEQQKITLRYRSQLAQLEELKLAEAEIQRLGFENIEAIKAEYGQRALAQYELDKQALQQKSIEEAQAKADSRLAEVEQIRLAQRTEEQVLFEAHENRKLLLDAAYNDQLITESKYQQLSERNWADYNQSIQDLDAAKSSALRTGASDLFGSLSELAAGFGDEQSALYRGMFAVSKAFAIADSIVKIQQGIASAAALPFPANIPAIASVVATTAGVVSTIEGTQLQYHTGGIVGRDADAYGARLRANEVRAVLERGEEVITAKDPRHRSNLSPASASATRVSAVPVQVSNIINIHNRSDAEVSMRERDDGGIEVYIDRIDEGLASKVQRGNSLLGDVIGDVFGNKRVASR